MLPRCLIILCIGAYISCKPTCNPRMKAGLIEVQDHLTKLMQLTKVKPRDPTRTSLPVPDNFQESCVKYHLGVFINSSQLVKPETEENVYENIQKGLKRIEKCFPTSVDNCTAPSKSVDQLLEYLKNFLTTLHSYE